MKKFFTLSTVSLVLLFISQTTLQAIPMNTAVVLGPPPSNQLAQQKYILQMEENILEQQKNLIQYQKQLIQNETSHQSETMLKQTQWLSSAEISSHPKDSLLIAGYGPEGPIHICHTSYNNGIQPGEMTDKGCQFTYGGDVLFSQNFQTLNTLSGVKSHWLDSYQLESYLNGYIATDNNNSIPLAGGHEEGHEIYICRVLINNALVIGKVVPVTYGHWCFVAKDGKEVNVTPFSVLFISPSLHTEG